MADSAPSLDELVAALEAAAPRLGEADQALALTLYRTLAEGAPVSAATLAERSGLTEDHVAGVLGSWPGVFYEETGRVIGFWGLALPPMAHGLRVDGRQLYTWCAWDPLFITPLLGREAEVASTCPVTGQAVLLRVAPDGVRTLSPPEAMVSFLRPDACWGEDVITSFCHFVLFFASPEAGRQWVAQHPGTFLLSIEEAFEVGRRYIRALVGSALGATGEPVVTHPE